jgi:MarR family transcriptional regulator, organic hydroperoxide resistance regulator
MATHEENVEYTLSMGDRFAREIIEIAPKDIYNLDILELTMAQFKIIVYLNFSGPSKMSRLTEELNVSFSTTTGIIDRMVKNNLIIREEDSSDRRLVLCRLTAKGRAILHNLWETLKSHTRTMVMEIPDEKLGTINQALQLLSEAALSAKAKVNKTATPV